MSQRILAIDDEPHMLRLLERIILEKTPHTIVTLSNSLELPDLLSKQSFDLIITDLKMPGMDGLDILYYIREHDRAEAVIIMTAFGSLDSAVEALHQGVFDYITKPFKKEDIIFAVDRALRFQQARRDKARLTKVYEVEPYRDAQSMFEEEYVRRLADRAGSDRTEMARRAELPEETIEQILGRMESGDR